jgi:hypothetical protein
MTNPTGRMPAGWYPDPLGHQELRWWDHNSWTEHTRNSSSGAAPQVILSSTLTWADDEPEREETPVVTPVVSSEVSPVAASLVTPGVAPVLASMATAEVVPERAIVPGLELAMPEWMPEVATSEASTTFFSRPFAEISGWAPLAVRLHHAFRWDEDVIVTASADGIPALQVDTTDRAFWWDRNLSDFPTEVGELSLTTEVRNVSAHSTEIGKHLEPLLWLLGRRAFSGEPAPWLAPGRFRLRRWPNLTSLEHDSDELQMTSVLGHAALTAKELAGIAEVTLAKAQDFINALSLMDLLRYLPEEVETPTIQPVAAPVDDAPRGLFGRLRQRLGL